MKIFFINFRLFVSLTFLIAISSQNLFAIENCFKEAGVDVLSDRGLTKGVIIQSDDLGMHPNFDDGIYSALSTTIDVNGSPQRYVKTTSIMLVDVYDGNGNAILNDVEGVVKGVIDRLTGSNGYTQLDIDLGIHLTIDSTDGFKIRPAYASFDANGNYFGKDAEATMRSDLANQNHTQQEIDDAVANYKDLLVERAIDDLPSILDDDGFFNLGEMSNGWLVLSYSFSVGDVDEVFKEVAAQLKRAEILGLFNTDVINGETRDRVTHFDCHMAWCGNIAGGFKKGYAKTSGGKYPKMDGTYDSTYIKSQRRPIRWLNFTTGDKKSFFTDGLLDNNRATVPYSQNYMMNMITGKNQDPNNTDAQNLAGAIQYTVDILNSNIGNGRIYDGISELIFHVGGEHSTSSGGVNQEKRYIDFRTITSNEVKANIEAKLEASNPTFGIITYREILDKMREDDFACYKNP